MCRWFRLSFTGDAEMGHFYSFSDGPTGSAKGSGEVGILFIVGEEVWELEL